MKTSSIYTVNNLLATNIPGKDEFTGMHKRENFFEHPEVKQNTFKMSTNSLSFNGRILLFYWNSKLTSYVL